MSRNCFSVWMSQDLWLPETVPDSSKRILVISDVSAIVPRSQMLKPKQHRRVLPSLEPLVKTAVYSTCSLLCLPLRVIELCFTRESRASVSPVKSVAPLETGWSVLWQMEKLTTKLAATSGDWSWIIPLIPPRSIWQDWLWVPTGQRWLRTRQGPLVSQPPQSLLSSFASWALAGLRIATLSRCGRGQQNEGTKAHSPAQSLFSWRPSFIFWKKPQQSQQAGFQLPLNLSTLTWALVNVDEALQSQTSPSPKCPMNSFQIF